MKKISTSSPIHILDIALAVVVRLARNSEGKICFDQAPMLWMHRRTEEGPLDGFLEFPGGKVEVGESYLEASVRELSEENQVLLTFEQQKGARPLGLFIHTYEDRKVHLNPIRFFWKDGPWPGKGGDWYPLWIEGATLNPELLKHSLAGNRAIFEAIHLEIKELKFISQQESMECFL